MSSALAAAEGSGGSYRGAVDDGVTPEVVHRDLPGDPGEVCSGAAEAALTYLSERLEAG